RPHDRLPVRPRLPLQHLGPSPKPRAPPPSHPDRSRSPRHRIRLVAQGKAALPSSGPGRGPPDRRPADDAALVLPLHRLVLPLAPGRNGSSVSLRRTLRAAAGCGSDEGRPNCLPRHELGAGTITGVIESARPWSLTSTTAPITHT